ncbi:MAG: thioredoxin family protein [bacterium]|nr:thioredoxin family protein [bacterium]
MKTILFSKFNVSYFIFILFLFVPTSIFAAEVIVDNSDPGCSVSPPYSWQTSSWGEIYGADKLYTSKGDGSKSVTWTANLAPGRYRVQAWVNPASYASDARYTIFYGTNSVTLTRSQASAEGKWCIDLGIYDFDTSGQVMLTNYWTGAEMYIVADAVKFIPVSTTEFAWSSNQPSDALANAKATGKAILLFFSTEKAVDAKKMVSETFTNPTVVKWGDKFVTVHIPVDKSPENAEPYSVYRVPVIIFLDSNGKEINRIEKFISAPDLVLEMNKALAQNVTTPQ